MHLMPVYRATMIPHSTLWLSRTFRSGCRSCRCVTGNTYRSYPLVRRQPAGWAVKLEEIAILHSVRSRGAPGLFDWPLQLLRRHHRPVFPPRPRSGSACPFPYLEVPLNSRSGLWLICSVGRELSKGWRKPGCYQPVLPSVPARPGKAEAQRRGSSRPGPIPPRWTGCRSYARWDAIAPLPGTAETGAPEWRSGARSSGLFVVQMVRSSGLCHHLP